MKIKIKAIASAIGLLTLLFASSGHATTYNLSSFATIDFNSASYINFSGDAEFIPLFGGEFTFATASANGVHFDNDPISAALNINEDGGSVDASANIGALGMLSTVNVADRGFGEATSEYILDYNVFGSGQIEVTVPYQISIDAQTGFAADPGSNASGLVSVEDGGFAFGALEFLDWHQGDGDGPIDNIGLLTFLMDVNDGDAGSLRFFAQAGSDLFTTPAAVPLPPSGLLMLGSLAGLAFRSRQRKI